MPRYFDKKGNELPIDRVRGWAVDALRRYLRLDPRTPDEPMTQQDGIALEIVDYLGTHFSDMTLPQILRWRKEHGAFRRVVRVLRKHGLHATRPH